MKVRTKLLRIGAGASFADDRIAPAVDLAERGELDYLVFECLAERTIARENLTRMKDPEKGYTPRLLDRMGAVLPGCLRNGVRIVSNMGAANPPRRGAPGHEAREGHWARRRELRRRAGDDVPEIVRKRPELPIMESGEPLESLLPRMASANAYLGADVGARALDTGAQVVITGRVADPSLFLGPRCITTRLALRRLDAPRLGHRRRPPARVLPRRSPAAASPIPARRTCRISRASAFRTPTSPPTGASGSASSPTRAAASTS